MLTGPLLITTFRNGKAYPHKLKTTETTEWVAEALIDLFQQSVGKKRAEIEEETKEFQAEQFNPKALQGLVKILFDRCEFHQPSSQEMADERAGVFDAASNYWREKVDTTLEFTEHKQKIFEQLKIEDADKLENTTGWLYQDIGSNAELERFESLTSEKLIDRFNIEQVQGLLIHAENLELSLRKKRNAAFRQVIQMLKFFRLMFSVREGKGDWITIRVDGPGSILENSRSYGIEIANFFPAVLLLSPPWNLTASLKISGRPRKFNLEISDDNPYRTFYRKKGTWAHQKVMELVSRFNKKYEATHRIAAEQSIINLSGNRYLLPDFNVRKYDLPENTDRYREMTVEWIQYLSTEKKRWLVEVRPELPEHYVFAVKGKKTKLKELIEQMGDHLLVYTTDLTAPNLKKRIDQL